MKCRLSRNMIYSRFRPLCKICALVAVSLVLPALAYAGSDNGKGNDGTNNGKGNDGNGNGKHIPVVPETNAAWVLVPFFGAVLFFSSRRFLSANLAEK